MSRRHQSALFKNDEFQLSQSHSWLNYCHFNRTFCPRYRNSELLVGSPYDRIGTALLRPLQSYVEGSFKTCLVNHRQCNRVFQRRQHRRQRLGHGLDAPLAAIERWILRRLGWNQALWLDVGERRDVHVQLPLFPPGPKPERALDGSAHVQAEILLGRPRKLSDHVEGAIGQRAGYHDACLWRLVYPRKKLRQRAPHGRE